MSSIFRSILEAFDPIKDELKRIDLDKLVGSRRLNMHGNRMMR